MDLSHIFNSKKILRVSFYAVLFSLLSFSANSQEHATADTAHEPATAEHGEVAEKDEDISKVILHHIADSHEWHFFWKYFYSIASYSFDRQRIGDVSFK